MTELVGSFRRPIFGGDGHVWLATRGPGEFVGECQSSSIDLENYTPMVLGQQRQRYGSQGAACACLRTIAGFKGITGCSTVVRLTACYGFLPSAFIINTGLWLHGSSAFIQQQQQQQQQTCCSQFSALE